MELSFCWCLSIVVVNVSLLIASILFAYIFLCCPFLASSAAVLLSCTNDRSSVAITELIQGQDISNPRQLSNGLPISLCGSGQRFQVINKRHIWFLASFLLFSHWRFVVKQLGAQLGASCSQVCASEAFFSRNIAQVTPENIQIYTSKNIYFRIEYPKIVFNLLSKKVSLVCAQLWVHGLWETGDRACPQSFELYLQWNLPWLAVVL